MPGYSVCRLAPSSETIRFVHANASAELMALVGARLGVSLSSAIPAEMPKTRFSLLSRRRSRAGAWRAHPLETAASEEGIEAFVRNFMSSSAKQGAAAASKEEL